MLIKKACEISILYSLKKENKGHRREKFLKIINLGAFSLFYLLIPSLTILFYVSCMQYRFSNADYINYNSAVNHKLSDWKSSMLRSYNSQEIPDNKSQNNLKRW